MSVMNSMNKQIDGLKHENKLLREVYEAARQWFQYNVVDHQHHTKAIIRLSDAIHAVKVLDSGVSDD